MCDEGNVLATQNYKNINLGGGGGGGETNYNMKKLGKWGGVIVRHLIIPSHTEIFVL